MAALLLTLLGCDPYAGTWVLFLEVTKSPNDDDEGRDFTSTARLYPLSDGRYSADVEGIPLVGTIEANELDLDYMVKTTSSSPWCDESSSMNDYRMQGTVSQDAGIDGTFTVTYETKTQGCGGDDTNKESYTYSVSGVKLNANDDAHVSSSASFGYVN